MPRRRAIDPRSLVVCPTSPLQPQETENNKPISTHRATGRLTVIENANIRRERRISKHLKKIKKEFPRSKWKEWRKGNI